MKPNSGAAKAKHGKVDRARRKLVKLIAAGGASAIASPWTFQTGRADGRAIKIGMVSPSTGPIAAFGEADQWVLAEAKKTLAGGITVAGGPGMRGASGRSVIATSVAAGVAAVTGVAFVRMAAARSDHLVMDAKDLLDEGSQM